MRTTRNQLIETEFYYLQGTIWLKASFSKIKLRLQQNHGEIRGMDRLKHQSTPQTVLQRLFLKRQTIESVNVSKVLQYWKLKAKTQKGTDGLGRTNIEKTIQFDQGEKGLKIQGTCYP